MKTSAVAGMIVGLHCIVIGSVVLMEGCGTTTKPMAGTDRETTIARPVPVEPEITPPRPTPGSSVVKPIDNASIVEPLPGKTEPVPGKKYTVQKGDSLSLIALKNSVTMKEILELNGLKNANKLKVGQELVLPASAKPHAVKPRTPPKAVVAPEGMDVYSVVKGDSLEKIAKKHSTSIKALKETNQLTSDKLMIGQKLVVPRQAAAVDTATAVTPAPVPGAVQAEAVTPAPAPSAAKAKPAPDAAMMEEAGTKAAAGAQGFTHTVSLGDDVDSVADLYTVSAEELMSLNNLTSKQLTPNTVLKIPAKGN